VEQALKESLRALLPEATVLAEETAGEEPLGDATWVVDPVDGTTNFAHGLPFVAVSVGLWLEDSVDLGVVYNPVLDQMFAALRGGGATMNGEPMRVSGAETLEQSLVATGFPYAIKDHLDEVVEVLRRVLEQCQGVRRYGAAALDLAHVAWGRLDGFFEATLKPWDTAAGWLLVEEAGGAVTAYDAGEPFGLYSPTVLASNGLVHRELSDILLKR
jgi:myo-inositol-1(or 4)-monophosphatase